MIKGVSHAHLGPIWYHSEPSEVPYFLNQFLGRDFFLPFLTANWLYGLKKYCFIMKKESIHSKNNSNVVNNFKSNLKKNVHLVKKLKWPAPFLSWASSLASSDAFSYNCRATELFFSSCSARPVGSGLLHTYLMPEMYWLYYRKAKVLYNILKGFKSKTTFMELNQGE